MAAGVSQEQATVAAPWGVRGDNGLWTWDRRLIPDPKVRRWQLPGGTREVCHLHRGPRGILWSGALRASSSDGILRSESFGHPPATTSSDPYLCLHDYFYADHCTILHFLFEDFMIMNMTSLTCLGIFMVITFTLCWLLALKCWRLRTRQHNC